MREGRRASSRTLVVHLLLGPDGPDAADHSARLGLVVSRAVGDAVRRNRVKRRLRHLARPELAALPPATVLVVRALPASASATSTELARDLGRCLQRVRS